VHTTGPPLLPAQFYAAWTSLRAVDLETWGCQCGVATDTGGAMWGAADMSAAPFYIGCADARTIEHRASDRKRHRVAAVRIYDKKHGSAAWRVPCGLGTAAAFREEVTARSESSALRRTRQRHLSLGQLVGCASFSHQHAINPGAHRRGRVPTPHAVGNTSPPVQVLRLHAMRESHHISALARQGPRQQLLNELPFVASRATY
jgi:hypothetical protein